MLKDEVTSWRRSFTAETSDDDLVLMMHKQVEHGPMHIAAKQELAARRESREQTRHYEIEAKLDDLRIPHWTGRYTFGFAVAAVIIALGAWLFPRAPFVPTVGLPSGSDRVLLSPAQPPARITEPAQPVARPPSPQVSVAIPDSPKAQGSASAAPATDSKSLPTPPKE